MLVSQYSPLSWLAILAAAAADDAAATSGVDLEPNEASNVLMDVTFRNVRVSNNTDDAFDISADTTHSIILDGVHASRGGSQQGRARGWGSAFSLNSLSGLGTIIMRDCTADGMGGAAIFIRRGRYKPAVGGGAVRGSDLTVLNFTADDVGNDWGGKYNGHTQGFYPITIASDASSQPLPMDESIKLDIRFRNLSAGGKAPGRPFIGCQTVSKFGNEPALCLPGSLWPLHGSVNVSTDNKTSCDTSGLPAKVATGLSVTCHAMVT